MDLFDNIGKSPIVSCSLLTLDQEIEKWKAEPDMILRIVVDGKTRYNNPCDWWRVNGTKFPILKSVAQIVKFSLSSVLLVVYIKIKLTIFRQVLAVPATSAPSERLASAAGNIVTVKRTRLTPIHVERLTFSHMNWERFHEVTEKQGNHEGKIVKNKKRDNVFQGAL